MTAAKTAPAPTAAPDKSDDAPPLRTRKVTIEVDETGAEACAA